MTRPTPHSRSAPSKDASGRQPAALAPLPHMVALHFAALLSAINRFADMIHEKARSITRGLLTTLSAGAIMVGAVSALAELLGYVLRQPSSFAAGGPMGLLDRLR